MALSKRVALSEFDYICSMDDAIDPEKSDHDKYCEDLDESFLEKIPGAEYSRVRCKMLSSKIHSGVMDKMKISEDGAGSVSVMLYESFRFGVMGIDNFEGWDSNAIQSGSPPFVKEQIMDKIPLNIISEVGSIILKKSHLTEGQKKN